MDLKNTFPEQVWCRIGGKGEDEVLIGICYRTPSERIYDFDIHSELRKMLHEVADSNFMLMGDFNYRNINWRSNVCESCVSVDTKMFMDCVQDSFLTQHVNCLTDRCVLDPPQLPTTQPLHTTKRLLPYMKLVYHI